MTPTAQFDPFMHGLRVALLVLAGIAAAICLIDWLVRTRKINPFSPVARFARRTIDPLITPVERIVVRAGGLPSSAPMWMLVAVVIAGLLLLRAVELLYDIALTVVYAVHNPAAAPMIVLSWVLSILTIALFVRVFASFFGGGRRAWWYRWSFALTEWMLAPLRRLIPTFGVIDITPLVAYFIIYLIRIVLRIP